eukprot:COSAG06_NODE_6503_length_2904_cov_2.120143_4_plen_125_part_00
MLACASCMVAPLARATLRATLRAPQPGAGASHRGALLGRVVLGALVEAAGRAAACSLRTSGVCMRRTVQQGGHAGAAGRRNAFSFHLSSITYITIDVMSNRRHAQQDLLVSSSLFKKQTTRIEG